MKKQKRCLFGQSFSGKKLFSEVIPLIVLFLSFASYDVVDNKDIQPVFRLNDCVFSPQWTVRNKFVFN